MTLLACRDIIYSMQVNTRAQVPKFIDKLDTTTKKKVYEYVTLAIALYSDKAEQSLNKLKDTVPDLMPDDPIHSAANSILRAHEPDHLLRIRPDWLTAQLLSLQNKHSALHKKLVSVIHSKPKQADEHINPNFALVAHLASNKNLSDGEYRKMSDSGFYMEALLRNPNIDLEKFLRVLVETKAFEDFIYFAPKVFQEIESTKHDFRSNEHDFYKSLVNFAVELYKYEEESGYPMVYQYSNNMALALFKNPNISAKKIQSAVDWRIEWDKTDEAQKKALGFLGAAAYGNGLNQNEDIKGRTLKQRASIDPEQVNASCFPSPHFVAAAQVARDEKFRWLASAAEKLERQESLSEVQNALIETENLLPCQSEIDEFIDWLQQIITMNDKEKSTIESFLTLSK